MLRRNNLDPSSSAAIGAPCIDSSGERPKLGKSSAQTETEAAQSESALGNRDLVVKLVSTIGTLKRHSRVPMNY